MTSDVPWLVAAKVTVPRRVGGYFHRRALFDRLRSLDDCRLIAVEAPAGFGKTTLLAEFCHRERQRGVRVAWITVDEEDAPDVLGLYLAFALEGAGLDLSVLHGLRGESPSLQIEGRTDLLLRAVELHGEPWLLVLDEVERLADRELVEMINALIERGPANLRIAIAFRSNPGIDVATTILAGRGTSVTDKELRFSDTEIARFFPYALPRREVAAIVKQTEGWPVALRICRDMGADGKRPETVRHLAGDRGLAAEYFSGRLLRGLSDEDLEFLFDLALFDWIDPALVDEVLEARDSNRRIDGLVAMQGFLQPMEGDANTRRMHPLVRSYCSAQRFQSDPDRFRELQVQIALALAARGHLASAMRHAREAGDRRLVGAILERAGGLQVLLRGGVTPMRAPDRFLTPEILTMYPRLALARCLLRIMQAKLDEARTLLDDVRRRTRDFTLDRPGGDDRALRVDSWVVQSMLVGCGCAPIGSDQIRRGLMEGEELARDPDLPSAIQGVIWGLLCVAKSQMARFKTARSLALRAAEHYRCCGSRVGVMYVDFHVGMIAMAQGRVHEAEGRYARAIRVAKQLFPRDPSPALVGDVLWAELRFEQDSLTASERLAMGFAARLRTTEAWSDIYAAAYAVASEITLLRYGAATALSLLEEWHEQTTSLGLRSVVRYLAALRVTLLVADGRVEEAERTWRAGGLPDSDAGLIDLETQTWREMEALTCARISLLAARDDLAGARDLADLLHCVSAERGLVRTMMRGLAQAMGFEHRAGETDRAQARMIEYLRLARQTDYRRPLTRDRDSTVAVLRTLLRTDIDADTRMSAKVFLTLSDVPDDAPVFTPRERDVLARIASGEKATETARRLGITENGVRYHLKKIYRKLHARGRRDAVRLARQLGVLPARRQDAELQRPLRIESG